MNGSASSIAVITLACSLFGHMPAQAAALNTYISGTGNDTGACQITAPCRRLSYAIGQTTTGGVINVLSAGLFGTVNITKSISIVADGVEALLQSASACPPGSGNAVICISGSATVVYLRGLTIDNAGLAGTNGIVFHSGRALHVQNCVIRNNSGTGIIFAPSASSELFVSNSTLADNGANGIGLNYGSSGTLNASLDHIHLDNNGSGLSVSASVGTIKATVRESVAAGNASYGIFLQAAGGSIINTMIDRTALVNNANGLVVFGATARLGDSVITGNGVGLAHSGGGIISYGTNKVNDNGSDGSPTSTSPMK
jgi:hypothetical protein